MKKKRSWKAVRMGNGSVKAMCISSSARPCEHCGTPIFWFVRKDNPEKKFPAHREGDFWYAHHIFCPVSGVLAKKTGQSPMI